MARETQATVWRRKAEEALVKVSRVMDFFLFATSQLVKLTEIHEPDDYSHCTCCKEPWPCQTMKLVQSIGTRFTIIQEETNDD